MKKDWTKKCTCENFQQNEDCEHLQHNHQFWRDRNPAECMTCGKTEIELWHTSGYPQLELLIEAFFSKEPPSETTEKTKDLMRECFLLGKKQLLTKTLIN